MARLIPKGTIMDGATPLHIRSYDDTGEIRTALVIKAEVTLSKEPGGGISVIKDKAEIDAEGYRKLNQYAGLHILQPPTVYVDGEVKGNPYYHRHVDPDTGEQKFIDRVVIASAVAGLSPLGKMVVIKKTLEFDVATYLNELLLNLIKKFPASGVLGQKDTPPTHFDIYKWDNDAHQKVPTGKKVEIPETKKLGYYPIHGHMTGVWLDLQHPEVAEMWSNYMTLLKFVSRRAETTILRLCMQDHPAIARKKVVLNDRGEVTIPVYFHRDGLSADQVKQLEASLGAGPQKPPVPAGTEILEGEVEGVEAGYALQAEEDDATQEGVESGTLNTKDKERDLGD